jgi:hypothetical protein
MTEHSVVLIVSFAIVAAAAVLIYVIHSMYPATRAYVDGCGQLAALKEAFELRQKIDKILANTARIDRSLRDQRSVLNDAHKRISAVTKGVRELEEIYDLAAKRILVPRQLLRNQILACLGDSDQIDPNFVRKMASRFNAP